MSNRSCSLYRSCLGVNLVYCGSMLFLPTSIGYAGCQCHSKTATADFDEFIGDVKQFIFVQRQYPKFRSRAYTLDEMDLAKMKNDRKVYLCKWYYRAGFAFLPFLWCVNAVWFFSEAFRKPAYEEQADIKKYVILSGIGAVVWLTALTAWIAVFQIHRAEWGEIADRMSFIIPTGIP